MRSLENLQRGECELWWWRPDSLAAELLTRRGMAVLNGDEMARYRRYLVPEAAHTFLAARVLLRTVLSAYCDVGPAEWRFETNQWGRPHIAVQRAPTGLRFNLSHKPRLVTCLVGWDRELGVDVEDLSEERVPVLELAERFFAPSEAEQVRLLSGGARRDRFFELWTLKEAYIKARGMGLSLGLSRFWFSRAGEDVTVAFDLELRDDPAAWDFRLSRPAEGHVIATAVRHGDGGAPRIHSIDAAGLMAAALA